MLYDANLVKICLATVWFNKCEIFEIGGHLNLFSDISTKVGL